MKVYSTQEIRNLGIVGHGDAGKTSLVAAMLFATGATNRLGKVDDGTTTTDYDEEEIARKISLNKAPKSIWLIRRDMPRLSHMPNRRFECAKPRCLSLMA